MMMSERCQDPESGLLLYLRTSSLQEVQAGINEMRGLIQLRNQLIVHLKDQVHWTYQKGIIKSPSPGLVVMGVDSRSKGRGLNKKGAGVGPIFF